MHEDNSLNLSILKDPKQINEIVDIHLESFQNFFLSFLGKGFLKQLYLGYLFDCESDIIIAKNDKEIVGYLAYSKDYSNFFKKLIKQRFFYFAYYSLLAFIKKPSVLSRLISAFSKSEEVKRDEKYIELASIAVKPNYEGCNIGSSLIENLMSLVDFDQYHFITLETDGIHNDRVIKFYEKNGFQKYREYQTKQNRLMFELRLYPKEGDINEKSSDSIYGK